MWTIKTDKSIVLTHSKRKKRHGEYYMFKSEIEHPFLNKMQDNGSKYASVRIFLFCELLLLLILPYTYDTSTIEDSVAFAQSESNTDTIGSSTNTILTDRSPSFLEAYWTDNSGSTSTSSTSVSNNNNSVRKEVGPGEGASRLAVVLVNKGRSEITALTGYLALPTSGFRAIQGENLVNSSDISVASHDSIVKPGETFTLYFTIDVLDDVKVGAYSGPLNLVYSKVLEVGQISTSITVPFRITGKVILDAASNTQNLVAGRPNDLKILIDNEGSANATGVVASITDVTEGATTPAASVNTDNGAGNDDSMEDDSYSNNNATELSNDEETRGEDEVVSETPTISLETTTFNVGNITAGKSVVITPTVHPSYSAGGTIQNLDLEISYNNAYGTVTTVDKSVGLVISPNPPESVLSISPVSTNKTASNFGNESSIKDQDSILLRAGKIEDVNFLVSNHGSTTLRDVVLSLGSSTNSVKILGDSRWTFNTMNASSKQELTTKVFAAEDVIASPIDFTIDAEYISAGQSKTDSLSIGAYVDGEIKIKAYDFAINSIGGTPNLVGNLLNQGNTVALFTTVEMINSERRNTATLPSSSSTAGEQTPSPLVKDLPSPQYLGDLSENSPLPFSIPLNIEKKVSRGSYPVTIKVTYTDNLRNPHEIDLNGSVNYVPESADSSNQTEGFLGVGGFSLIIIGAVIILAGVFVLFILVRKRIGKKKRSSKGNTQDVEFFDDKLISDENTKEGDVKQ
jgi:hypothetical protein